MPATTPDPLRPLAIALAGLVSLGVAMGIGRFAFTPILPVMLAERTVDLPGASLLASANYLGYLLGALACTFQPWLWRRFGWHGTVNGPALVRGALAITALLTAAMAVKLPGAWVLLRFAAGVASAVAFLYTSSWCLEQLARRGQPALGALIYVGPGVGIVVSGLATSALVALHAPASVSWLAAPGYPALQPAEPSASSKNLGWSAATSKAQLYPARPWPPSPEEAVTPRRCCVTSSAPCYGSWWSASARARPSVSTTVTRSFTSRLSAARGRFRWPTARGSATPFT